MKKKFLSFLVCVLIVVTLVKTLQSSFKETFTPLTYSEFRYQISNFKPFRIAIFLVFFFILMGFSFVKFRVGKKNFIHKFSGKRLVYTTIFSLIFILALYSIANVRKDIFIEIFENIEKGINPQSQPLHPETPTPLIIKINLYLVTFILFLISIFMFFMLITPVEREKVEFIPKPVEEKKFFDFGKDFKKNILACYKLACRFLERKGVKNFNHWTHREFEREVLENLELEIFKDMTFLFERARYSTHRVGKEEWEKTLKIYKKIVGSFDEGDNFGEFVEGD